MRRRVCVRCFDEVDPARDVHTVPDLLVVADAVGQKPVDRQHPRVDAAAGQRSVKLGLRPIQSLLGVAFNWCRPALLKVRSG